MLIAQPDDPLRRHLIRGLRAGGFSPIEADCGDVALVLANRTAPIDILITDSDLPGRLTGIHLALALHALQPTITILYSYCAGRKDRRMPSGSIRLRRPFHVQSVLKACRSAALDSPCARRGDMAPLPAVGASIPVRRLRTG